MKKRILRFTILIVFSLLFLQTRVSGIKKSDDLFPRTSLEFYILESEFSEGKYITGDLLDLGFSKYIDFETTNSSKSNNVMITFRAEFFVDVKYRNQNLYLVTKPVNSPCNIYLNGSLIFERGNIKNGYTSRMHYSEYVLLPPSLINFDKKNQIAFQLYPKEGETHPLDNPFITNSQEAKTHVFYRNLLGPKLVMASSFCGLIFFIYFLFTYISRKEYNEQQYLYFALMNLFVIFSLINNILTYDYTNTFLIEIISRLGFLLSMIAGLFFLIEYTTVFKNKYYFKIGVLVLYVPALVMLIFQPSLARLIAVNNSYPMYILSFGNFTFVVITLLFFLKEKNTKSFILFIVYLVNLFAGFYDSYFFVVLKVKPFLLLTPNSVFLMNLAIFFILLIDQSKIYHLAINKTQELHELNENLEVIVEERTKKTQEYANKLEEANKTKDKFFSIIAHDMKNPFNTLIGYSDILRSDFREYGQDEIYQQLNIIHSTSVKGFNLLENLLQWSQTQTEKIVFEPKKINLYEIVQSSINNVEDQSQFKDIDINNDVDVSYHIIADENLFKTIIRNLISNAIKYTPRNGMVTITTERNKTETIVSIKDTGVGMSEKEIDNLFKIDKIYSKPGTNKERGSGLGLILCKEFVEKHGGRIWVDSKPDIGSVFNFSVSRFIQMN